MTDARTDAALVPVWRGHALLLACAMLYLAWWVTFFRPGAQVRGGGYALGVACIVGAAACGLIGAPLVAGSLGRIPGAEGVSLAGSVVGGLVRAALYVLIALLACASLVCYVLYYRLDPMPAFIDGTVPLVAVAIESAVMLAVAR